MSIIRNWDEAIVVYTLSNVLDGRTIHVTRKVDDPCPCDNNWRVEAVDYIDVEIT